MNPLNVRDTHAKRDKAGTITVTLAGHEHSISYREAENLLGSLLKAVPGVPAAVEQAWRLRLEPKLRIRVFHGVVGEEILPNAWMGEIVDSFENVLVRGPVSRASEAEAAALACGRYGRDLPVSLTFDSPGSYEKAEEELVVQLATQLAEAEGLTLAQFIKKARGR